MLIYRERLYKAYLRNRHGSHAPKNIEDLKPRAAYLYKVINDHFPDDRQALIVDLGCGHGALIYFARKQGYQNITGIDRSPQQVAEARQLGIDQVSEGDLLNGLKSYNDQSLDAVITFDVIEHLTKDELIQFSDEVYRVLKNNGRWIIHAPNGESPFFGRIRYGDITHEQAFTHESITQLLRAIGYSHISCYEDKPIPHGIKSAVRWFLWKSVRGILRLYMLVETGSGSRDSIFTQNFLTVATK